MQTNFTSFRRASRSLGLVTVGVLSTLGALSLTHVGPAQAQPPGVNLAQLVAEVNSLQSTVSSQGITITCQAAQIAALQAKTAPLSLSNDPAYQGHFQPNNGKKASSFNDSNFQLTREDTDRPSVTFLAIALQLTAAVLGDAHVFVCVHGGEISVSAKAHGRGCSIKCCSPLCGGRTS